MKGAVHQSKRQKVYDENNVSKHVSWGEATIREIPKVVSKKMQLKEKLKNLDLVAINNLLLQNNEDSQELLSKEGIITILVLANEYAQSAENYHNYNSEAFKSILIKLKHDYYETIRNVFAGLRINLILKKKSDIEPQVFSDYTDAMKSDSTNENIVFTNSSTHISESSQTSDSSGDLSASATSDGDQKIEASLSVIDNEESDKGNNIAVTQTEDSSNLSALLNRLLSWIYELPEWLQEQILDSAPVKALIESTEQWAAMHDKKSTADLFAELFTVDLTSDSTDSTEDNINSKATVDKTSIENHIDTSMVLNNSTVNGWILPTVAPNDFFIGSDSAFNDFPINFNGLNGIDLF